MRFKKYITEKFYKSGKMGGKYIEIYENPDGQESRLFDFVRFFILPKKKKIYIFDGNKTIHYMVYKILGTSLEDIKEPVFQGSAIRKNGRLTCIESDEADSFWRFKYSKEQIEKYIFPQIVRAFEYDYKWADDYILVTPYINKIKKYFKKVGYEI